jgi:hypothetical protein
MLDRPFVDSWEWEQGLPVCSNDIAQIIAEQAAQASEFTLRGDGKDHIRGLKERYKLLEQMGASSAELAAARKVWEDATNEWLRSGQPQAKQEAGRLRRQLKEHDEEAQRHIRELEDQVIRLEKKAKGPEGTMQAPPAKPVFTGDQRVPTDVWQSELVTATHRKALPQRDPSTGRFMAKEKPLRDPATGRFLPKNPPSEPEAPKNEEACFTYRLITMGLTLATLGLVEPPTEWALEEDEAA